MMAVLVSAAAFAAHSKAPAGAVTAPSASLTPAFSSADDLIGEFLRALETNDSGALRRLRVTEAEYRKIILPGSVGEGQPLRQYRPDVADFAWGQLDTKSSYWELALLNEYRGRHFVVKAVEYDKGVTRYANHVGYRQIRLRLEEPATGGVVKLGTGSIAEVGGRYKFVSFIRD